MTPARVTVVSHIASGGNMKTVATAIAFATAALVLAPTAVACAAEPTRVLIVGDSVTHGIRGDYTWRYFAWKALMQSGASVDFVGPHSGTNGIEADQFFTGPYADADFDTDHAARWGMAMHEMLDAPDATSPAIGDLVEASDPDVIVEQLGVNDFDREGLTAGEMESQVRQFVADARAVKPEVDVVLGSLPQTWIREVSAYNAALPALAGELTTDESRLTATPVAAFTNGVDTYDFAHPTTSGQEKIAAAVSVGLERLGIGRAFAVTEPAAPAAGPTATTTTAPEPGGAVETAEKPAKPHGVRATRKGIRTRVAWRPADHADRYVVKCGTANRVSVKTTAALRSRAAACRVQAVNEAGTSGWTKVQVKPQR